MLTDSLNIIKDYVGKSTIGKLICSFNIEKESMSKWHTVVDPKSEISSYIVKDEIIVPDLKLNLLLKKLDIRVYEGYDFWFK